ncbi:MAG: PAS domain-containing protein [Acutalibacteraceae bacterium]|jgi:PAS domain S-box-containing protein
MKNTIQNTKDILYKNVSGFHQYVLNDPVHLSYVSQNLCQMTGYSEDELLSDSEDLYASLVHPSDRAKYLDFISALKQDKQTLKAEYRIVKKDGGVVYVLDTASCEVTDDGTLVGYSVLADITDIKKENNNLQFLNETIPCGFLKYTCEKQPKVTYINQQMKEILRFPKVKAVETDYLDLFRDNIFLMIPMEDRRRFSLYLNRVYSAGTPLAGEMTLLRCDGTRAHVFGWVTKCVNEDGKEEFQSVCMDITERHQSKKSSEVKRYLKALTEVYDKIFEYDLGANTVKCLYSNNSTVFKWLEDIPMQIEDATKKWIDGTVAKEDRERVHAFFGDFIQKKLYRSSAKPPQITYKAKSSSGETKLYRGIFIKMDDLVSLFCCRCVQDTAEADTLRNENVHLKENMQELLMRFTDGIAAFEVTGSLVTPLYASDNVCEFFGYTKEEWLPLMKQSTPIKEFVSRSKASYDQILELLKTGEAEFSYYDLTTKSQRRIKAICSQRTADASSPRYIMLYNVDDNNDKNGGKVGNKPAVTIRTFGYFDVFVGEKPIAFRNKKAKELFALLVDRRGGYVSSEEAISFLWEDEPVSPVTLARYRKVALRLKNTLEEYGISDVMETVDGKRRIVPEKVDCDLYNYLSNQKENAHLFKGSYLSNYSWGENTLAQLAGDILY